MKLNITIVKSWARDVGTEFISAPKKEQCDKFDKSLHCLNRKCKHQSYEQFEKRKICSQTQFRIKILSLYINVKMLTFLSHWKVFKILTKLVPLVV